MCVYVCGCVSFLYRCLFIFCFVPCFSHVFFFLFFFFFVFVFAFTFSPPPFLLACFFFSILKTFSKEKKKTQRHDDNYDASRQVALKLTTEENKSK